MRLLEGDVTFPPLTEVRIIFERDLNYGLGILLLLIIFEFGFVAVTMVFAEPVLRTLTWPAVLLGNLLVVLRWRSIFGAIILHCGSYRK